jgi:hypothetical protein
VISSSQGLYLHRTTQQRKTTTTIHAFSGIRTRDPVYERSRPAPQTARPLDWHPITNKSVSCPATRHGGVWPEGGRGRYSSHSFLTSALDGGEWSASRPGRPYPRGKDPRHPFVGAWVGPRAGPDAGARRKILCPCRGSNPDRPASSQTLYCLIYRGSYPITKTNTICK